MSVLPPPCWPALGQRWSACLSRGASLLTLLAFSERAADTQPVFEDKTSEAGLRVESPSGIAAVDYDNDGWTDLMVAADSSNSTLFRNLGDGQYSDETAPAGLSLPGSFHSPLFADLDNDGWPDLLMVGTGETRLFLSNQAGGFVERTEGSGLAGAGGKTATLGDFDNDGLLDLFLAISHQPDRLLRNLGGGVFDDVSAEAKIGGPPGSLAMQALWWDFNHDGLLDLVAVHDIDEPSRLYRNNGELPFTDVAVATGFSAVGSGNSMGVGVGDIDGDGWEDVYVTRIGEGGLYRNYRGVTLTMVEDALGAWRNGWSWGVVAGDFDNDADQDLFIVSTSGLGSIPTLLFENRRWLYELSHTNWLRGGVSDKRASEAFSFGLAQADLDRDGRLDLAYPAQDGRVVLLHGAGRPGNWLQVQLEGVMTNRDGIGARIEARTPSRVLTRSIQAGDSYRSQSDPVVHLGLGRDDRVDELVVHWGGAHRDTLHALPAGARYVVRQGAAQSTGTDPATPTGRHTRPPIEAYPLPATSRVTLRIGDVVGPASIAVSDFLGREQRVQSVTISESHPWEAVLDVEGLPAGVYWIRVTTKDRVFVRAMPIAR